MVIGDAEFLDEDYSSEEEIEARLSEGDAVSEKDWQGNPLPKSEIIEAKKRLENTLLQRDTLRKILINELGITPMDSIINYISQIRIDRAKEIELKDSYDVGINYSCDILAIKEYQYESKDISKINEFLKSTSLCDRILFYRNSTYKFILSEDYDKEIKRLIIENLKKDGFNREAQILTKKYK